MVNRPRESPPWLCRNEIPAAIENGSYFPRQLCQRERFLQKVVFAIDESLIKNRLASVA